VEPDEFEAIPPAQATQATQGLAAEPIESANSELAVDRENLEDDIVDTGVIRAEFEVVPLDREDLEVPMQAATSELPPVMVSNEPKTFSVGSSEGHFETSDDSHEEEAAEEVFDATPDTQEEQVVEYVEEQASQNAYEGPFQESYQAGDAQVEAGEDELDFAAIEQSVDELVQEAQGDQSHQEEAFAPREIEAVTEPIYEIAAEQIGPSDVLQREPAFEPPAESEIVSQLASVEPSQVYESPEEPLVAEPIVDSTAPEALDQVVADLACEIVESVDLANLSGNRTEISFLEEIVESELASESQWQLQPVHSDQQALEDSPPVQAREPEPLHTVVEAPPVPEVEQRPVVEPAPQPVPAAAQQQLARPAPQPVPAVAQQPLAQPAPQPVPAAAQQPLARPAPQPVPAVAQQPLAQPAPQPVPAVAQQPLAQPAPQPVPTAQQQPAVQPHPASQTPAASIALDPSIVALATQILTQAISTACSHVHFQSTAEGVALRFILDGEVQAETLLPAQIQPMLVLCLKSMAGLDPNIVDRPQDKSFVTNSFGDPVTMRVTCFPGAHGETVAVSLK
jgi:hypothetical protein